MILPDANVILRYLLNDHEQMSAQAEKYIQEEDTCMTIEVAAEVVYVLRRVYSVERNKISESVKCILNQISCTEPEVLHEALSIYGETSLDFVDCVPSHKSFAHSCFVINRQKKPNYYEKVF